MSDSVDKSIISEQKFETLFKGMPFPLYVWKIIENDLILVEYNYSAEKITNGQIKNYLGCKASEFYKDQFELYEGLYQCVNSQCDVFKEVKSICITSGEEKFLSVYYNYIPPDLVLVQTGDITERKKTEQKLKASEEKYKSIAEFLPDIIYEIDKSGKLSYVNPEGYEKFNYQKDEVIGKMSMIQFVLPEQREKLIRNVNKFFSGELIEPDIYTFQKKDGTTFYGRVHSRPIYKEGKIVGIRGVLHDIHELVEIEERLKKLNLELEKRVEERTKELRESEEQYRTIINSLADPLDVVDRDLKILLINPAFELWLDNLGIEKNVVGKIIFEAFPFLPKEIREDYKQIFDTGKLQSSEGSTFIDDKVIITETLRIPIFKEGHVNQVMVITRDITERKRAEMKIKESEEKYRLLTENINDLIAVIDDKFQIEYINEEVHKKVLGTTINDLLGKNILDFVNPDDRVKGFNSLLNGIKNKEGMMDIRVLNRTGHYIWFEVKGKAFLDNKGELKGILIARDITERKQAEEKLRESEERYRTLVETMTDGLAAIDENNNFTYINISFSKMIGYSNDELLGTQVFNYLDKKNQSIVEEQLKQRRKGVTKPYELVWTRKDRHKVYTIMAPKPLIDVEGNYVGAFGVITNITERIIAEQKLMESEAKYRNLFESSPAMIVLINPNGKIIDVNPATLAQYGFERNDFINKDFNELNNYLPENLPFLVKKFKELLIEGILEPIELPFYTKDKNIIWVNIQGSSVKIGDETYIQTVIQDINERKMAELKIKESEEKLKTLNDTFLKFTDDPLKNIQLLVEAAGKLISSECATYNKLIDVNGKEILKTIAIWQEPTDLKREDNPIGHIFTDIINMGLDEIVILKDLDKTKYAKTDPNVQKYNLKQYCGIAIRLNNKPIASFCLLYTKNREMSEVDKDIIRILAKSASIEEQRLYSYQQIKESEHKFKLIFDSIPDLFFLINKETRILSFRGREEDFYVPSEKLINSKLNELLPGDLADRNYIAAQKTLLTKQPQIIEYELPIYGVNRYFEARHLYFSENQVAIFIREITARKKAEQELIQSEEKYRQLFENSPEIIVLTSPDGVILDVNSGIEKTLGFKKEEVIGHPYYKFGICDSNQISIIKHRYEDSLLGKRKKFEEFQVKRKDGSSLWVLYQTTIVKLGNQHCILTMAQDITEIKKAEKLIEQELIKLKELDDIKNELITRASHELKTPLTSILGSTDLLLTLYHDAYNNEIKELINMIHKGAKRLENLIKNTIDISLIESKTISFRRTREDIGKLINECMDDLIYLADKRELSFEINIQENVFIQIDKNKVIQVIKNIISNAIKNTPLKGKVSINLKRMKKYIEISIKDTGVGFTGTELQRIFQKFGKIERYGKDFDVDIEGPGLGLYLAKQIIEMHKGKIWAESEGLHKGATFIIELPID